MCVCWLRILRTCDTADDRVLVGTGSQLLKRWDFYIAMEGWAEQNLMRLLQILKLKLGGLGWAVKCRGWRM